MYTPINIITSVTESITFLWIMLYLTNVTSLSKIFSSTTNIPLIIFSFTFTLLLQINENIPQVLKGFIVIFLHFLITKYISHSKPKEAITSVIFTYVLECLLQMPVFVLFLLFFPNTRIVDSDIMQCAVIISGFLLTLVIYHFIKIKIIYQKLLKIPGFIFAALFFYICLIAINTFYFYELNALSPFMFFAIMAFLFLTLFLALFFAIKAHKKEQTVHYYETYLPILDDMIFNIRKTQHNYNNIIQAISNLPGLFPDYNSLADALKCYSSHMIKDAIPAQLLHFENKLLIALLYNEYCLAVNNKICLDINIHNYSYKSRADEFQIVDLTGILLDNAIEASRKNDTIYIEIGSNIQEPEYNHGSSAPYTITIKNPGPEVTQDFIKRIFSHTYTSKTNNKSKHGLGLPYVKNLVQTHKGTIELFNETINNYENIPCQYLVIHITI